MLVFIVIFIILLLLLHIAARDVRNISSEHIKRGCWISFRWSIWMSTFPASLWSRRFQRSLKSCSNINKSCSVSHKEGRRYRMYYLHITFLRLMLYWDLPLFETHENSLMYLCTHLYTNATEKRTFHIKNVRENFLPMFYSSSFFSINQTIIYLLNYFCTHAIEYNFHVCVAANENAYIFY